MMFTDGGEDRAQEIFEKYNWPNKTVSLLSVRGPALQLCSLRHHACLQMVLALPFLWLPADIISLEHGHLC